MRLLICAGGTGGGVYPALAVLQAMTKDSGLTPEAVLWVGGQEGMEADLVARARIAYESIPAAGVHGVGLGVLPGNLMKLARGYLASRRILARFRPDVLFFTGGYVAVPMALAGRSLPSLLYVPDIEPGMALNTLARFAEGIALTAPDSQSYFSRTAKGALHVTGYPTRPELTGWDMETARQALHLASDLPTLLVAGGSKGSRSINKAVLKILPELLSQMQVILISGQLDWPEVQVAEAGLSTQQATRFHPYPYLHEEMGAALTVADLVVSRAGASILGEYPLFGLPAILVPYPYAWRYQKVNADYLVQRGAALMVEDEHLGQNLLPTVIELMQDRPRREAMRYQMQALKRPQAAQEIARLLHQLAGKNGRKKG